MRHNHAPNVGLGECDIVIFVSVRRIAQNRKIQEPLVQLFSDLFSVATGDVVSELGINAFEFTYFFCKMSNPV